MSQISHDLRLNGQLGLDIAKATFESCLLQGKRCYRRGFPNTCEGVRQLLGWLEKHASGPVVVALESTGRYGELVTSMLHEAGHQVSVVNARWIKDHAKSQGRRNKTDRSDAAIIADYACTHDMQPWSPPPAEKATLRALLHRIRELEAMLQAERNRRECLPITSPLLQSLDRTSQALQEEIARIEKTLAEHIDSHPRIKADCERLEAVPGIGPKSARWLIAELTHAFPNCRAAAAWVGVTPRLHESGTSVKKRLGTGPETNAALRSLLYLPAVVARNRNPALKAFADRLQSRGMSKKAVVLAVMHKLVRIAFALIKNQSTYDPNYFPKAFSHLQNQPA